ncbi:MAG: hypothetical protein KF816_15140 [Melioribacteraceae bacterium]|nr:hypothetical protein [Melioribacteraceae bacterium]
MNQPQIVIIILFMSIIAWAMPMIRQANSKLFFYFYTIALADPMVILLANFRVLSSNEILALFTILNFFSLKYIVVNKKIFYALASLMILLYILLLFGPNIYFLHCIAISKFFNLIVFLLYTLRFVAATSRVNIFHLILLFYEITIITKIAILFKNSETTLIYFIVTTLFQVLIAIWFTIFKEDNPKLHLNLRNI